MAATECVVYLEREIREVVVTCPQKLAEPPRLVGRERPWLSCPHAPAARGVLHLGRPLGGRVGSRRGGAHAPAPRLLRLAAQRRIYPLCSRRPVRLLVRVPARHPAPLLRHPERPAPVAGPGCRDPLPHRQSRL